MTRTGRPRHATTPQARLVHRKWTGDLRGLSAKAGIHHATLCRYMAGGTVTVNTLQRLAVVLNVPLSRLIRAPHRADAAPSAHAIP